VASGLLNWEYRGRATGLASDGFQMTNFVILKNWGVAKKGPENPWQRRQGAEDTAWKRNQIPGVSRIIQL
jgi:hypothetical protein